jgi:D-sedoheptulose 7-phosphate isomerase
MKDSVHNLLENFEQNHVALRPVMPSIICAFQLMARCFETGNKLLICGNGGSNADADHIVGELVKGFMKKRPLPDKEKEEFAIYGAEGRDLSDKLQGALPAINLGAQNSLLTAIVNDTGGDIIFAQQVYAYGRPDDILVGITTSGNSKNILNAGLVAKIKRLKTIALTGNIGGKASGLFDCVICVPSNVVHEIQDMHSAVYHFLCLMIESEFWDN